MAANMKENPCRGKCKLNCILQGEYVSFPGNCTLIEYFQTYITENKIQSKVALIDEDKKTTFGEFDEISTRMALVIKGMAEEKRIQNVIEVLKQRRSSGPYGNVSHDQ